MLSELHRLLFCELSEVSWWILKRTPSILWHVHYVPTSQHGLSSRIYHGAVFKSFRSCLNPEGRCVSQADMHQTGRCCAARCPFGRYNYQLDSKSTVGGKLWQVSAAPGGYVINYRTLLHRQTHNWFHCHVKKLYLSQSETNVLKINSGYPWNS